jgi:mono/diheme cytochrome c family protein
MMGKRKTIRFSILICSFIYGCSRQLYIPSSTDATKQAELLQGRKLYVGHCGSCHNLHLPKEYTADQWKKNVDEMQGKAKITDNEKMLIIQYLTFQL